jgi:TRAP-type mannitol/chloroaromatic compound transport system substrate-binding protein
MSLSRRRFISTAAVAGGLTAVSGLSPALAQRRSRVRWNMPTSWPQGLLLQDSATMFAQKVAELTDGEFEIRVRPAGELVPPLEVFGAVQAGTVECGHSWSAYLIGQNAAMMLEAGIPFGLTAEQHAAWLRDAGGAEMLDEVFARFNVKSFLVGDIGAQMMGWFNKEINSLDDVRGLRLRIAGLGGQIFQDVGVSVQLIPVGEMLAGLERGVIDGAAGGTPTDNIRLGLHRVAKYWYYPGWNSPSAAMSCYVNRNAWAALPDDFQRAFETAALAAHSAHVTHCQEADRRTIATLKENNPEIEFRALPEDVMDAVQRAAFRHYERFAEEQEDFRRIFPEWQKFTAEVRALQDMTVHPLNAHRLRSS